MFYRRIAEMGLLACSMFYFAADSIAEPMTFRYSVVASKSEIASQIRDQAQMQPHNQGAQTSKGAKHRSWVVSVPLAISDPNQKVISRKVRSRLKGEITAEPRFGNEVWVAPYDGGDVDVQVEYVLELSTGRAGPKEHVPEIPGLQLPSNPEYLQTHLNAVKGDDHWTRKVLARVDVMDGSPLGKAQGIYRYLMANLEPAPSTTETSLNEVSILSPWGSTPSRTLDKAGTAIPSAGCLQYQDAFIQLLRSSQIIARKKTGIRFSSAKIPAAPSAVRYHCWVEFYLPKIGWVPVDPYTQELEERQSKKTGSAYWGVLPTRLLNLYTGSQYLGKEIRKGELSHGLFRPGLVSGNRAIALPATVAR